jgi:hypothetical protein
LKNKNNWTVSPEHDSEASFLFRPTVDLNAKYFWTTAILQWNFTASEANKSMKSPRLTLRRAQPIRRRQKVNVCGAPPS